MVAVTVYSTGPACQRCRLTCRRLDEAGISYRVVDLRDEANANARAFITDDLRYTEAPVVMLDGDPEHHWCGFRPDLIDRLTRQAPAGAFAASPQLRRPDHLGVLR